MQPSNFPQASLIGTACSEASAALFLPMKSSRCLRGACMPSSTWWRAKCRRAIAIGD